MSKITTKPSTLTGGCHNCYKPALYYPKRDEYLRPDFATYYHRCEDELEHLKALLQPVLTTWAGC